MYIISTLYFNRYTGQNQIKLRKTSFVHDTYLEIQCLNVCEGRRAKARHIDTRTNRHQDISALTKTYRHWDKSARTLDKSEPSLTNRHFGKILMYFHVYSTFSKK